MVVCADPYDRDLVRRRLKEVLVHATDDTFEKCESVTEAAHRFADAAMEFVLLVVDVHVPLVRTEVTATEPRLETAIGEGGYLFLENHVLSSGYPPPPILLFSRFGDFRPVHKRSRERRKDHPVADQLKDHAEIDQLKIDTGLDQPKIAELDIAHFTTVVLDRTLRRFGVSSELAWPPLFEDEKLDQEPASAAEYVSSRLKPYFIDIYCAEDQKSQGERAWNLVSWIDDALKKGAIREKVFANDKVVRRISQWYQRLQTELEDRDPRNLAWFHMLRADLLWRLRPDESLYSLMKTIELNLMAHVEPLGGPGDATYRIASRLNADQKRLSRIRAWIVRSKLSVALAKRVTNTADRRRSELKEEKGRSLIDLRYKEKIWHNVLRFQVTNAARRLKGSPEALLDIENRLARLSSILQESGHARAAHELEARSCQVRIRRLSPIEKSTYWLLYRLCDYGNRPIILLGWSIVSVLFFAAMYLPMPHLLARLHFPTIQFKNWPYVPTEGLERMAWLKAAASNWITAIYFSIVTFVTLGYGDITPANWAGKVVAAAEAIWGFTMFGLSIAVLSTRLRPR